MNWFVRTIVYLAIAVIVSATTLWTVVDANRAGTAKILDTADCAVVFGAGVWSGGRPSHAMHDRVSTGVKLYKSGRVECLILSGGPTFGDAHEVDVMTKLAMFQGTPRSAVVQDHQGHSTLDTLSNLDQQRSYLLVSNSFHLARIRMMAWKLGLENKTVPALQRFGPYIKENWFQTREVIGLPLYFLLY